MNFFGDFIQTVSSAWIENQALGLTGKLVNILGTVHRQYLVTGAVQQQERAVRCQLGGDRCAVALRCQRHNSADSL
ncbi:hypothetical protein [Kamptonema formosum]|uniref:hypothetical protein n=1 Tax=Kamptonema formosum TaxID=331992 RepID=UPI000476D20E|nr:hypothetical protein [Oscillatoria sp. PCC 10802]